MRAAILSKLEVAQANLDYLSSRTGEPDAKAKHLKLRIQATLEVLTLIQQLQRLDRQAVSTRSTREVAAI
jgi:hypothetical protein